MSILSKVRSTLALTKAALVAAVVFVFSNSALALQVNHQPPFVPLYSSYSAESTDYFYTINQSEFNSAVSNGFANRGIVGYLERRQQPNTKPFKRFYKGPPQREHFYTTDEAEVALILSYGWVYEGVEGYIYTSRVPGSVPLYRVNKWTDATADLVHKYTVDWSEVQDLWGQGWGYDGVAGYVYGAAFPFADQGWNAPQNWIAGLRCPNPDRSSCWIGGQPINFRDYYFPSLFVPATVKTGSIQVMDFTFWSPDFFGDVGHLAFGMHGQFNEGRPNLLNFCPGMDLSECTWYRGLGPIIYGQSCDRCGGSSVGSEAFWNLGNDVVPPNQFSGQLRNNTQYHMSATVSDAGLLTYSITDLSSGQVVVNTSWDTAANQVYPQHSPFPNHLTGFFMLHATDNTRDFTFYVTNYRVFWVNPWSPGVKLR
jgi:Repeat of unknown function (DUF5648)